MPKLPSTEEIFKQALKIVPDADVNALHAKTFELMLQYKLKYYERRVDEILNGLDLPKDIFDKIKNRLLEPVVVNGKEYSNIMEEVTKRISQALQPISGNLAELCVERELERAGLRKGIHFTKRKDSTDFIIYFPNIHSSKTKHRVEVKNVSLRERATRGLSFDGDSLFGFFNQINEFTESNVKKLEELCKAHKVYCYIPPNILNQIPYNTTRFRSNLRFGKDMFSFAMTGGIP